MDKNLTPKVTVLLPVYNAEPYLKEAIDSILSQTLDDFECLIINDGSTDNTELLIKHYNDKRIRYIKNKQNLKLIATLNKGIELSKGTYIARMDSDDIALPTRLEKQYQYLEKHKDVAVCGSNIEYFGNKVGVSNLPEKFNDIRYRLMFDSCLAHPSVMIRKDFLIQYKLRYEYEFVHAEDYALWTKIATLVKIVNLPDILLKYRTHSESISSTKMHVQTKKLEQISLAYLKSYFPKYSMEQLKLIRNALLKKLSILNIKEFKLVNQALKKIWSEFRLNNSKYKKEYLSILKSIYLLHSKNKSGINIMDSIYFIYRLLLLDKLKSKL